MKNIPANSDCSIDQVKHQGIITKIDDQYYYVSILTQSACAECHAKGMCTVPDMKEQVIEIPVDPGFGYKAGDRVEVVMKRTLGSKAVLLGYVIPFLILLAALVIFINLLHDDGLAGLTAILTLVPYYFILYLARNRLKKTFTFNIN